MPRRGTLDPRSPSTAVGLCAYARVFADHATRDPQADAVVVTTVCDQLRRITELPPLSEGPPLFLMNVPTTWQSAAARELYLGELERLGRFLVDLGGSSPTPDQLAAVMIDYDRRRAALRALRTRLSARAFSESIARFHERGEIDLDVPDTARPSRGIPVALVGAPLLEEHLELFDLVERYGGEIVLDATETGERTLPGPLDRDALTADPLEHLADLYFGRIPSAFRRPNDPLHHWLQRELAARGVRGILFKRYVWCDLWNAECERLRESVELPLLALDTDDQGLDRAVRTRVQALIEVLG